MKWSKHLKIAGALQIAHSFMLIPFAVIYVILYIRDLQEGSHTFELLMALILALALFVGVCQLWFGISLAMQKRWTTGVVGYICCGPSLIFFPPLIIAAYTIWGLVQTNKQKEQLTAV